MANVPLLPNFIPPQTAPIAKKGPNNELVMDVNWYLFFYNLANQVISNGSSAPVSPSQIIDSTDLEEATTDIPQAYVKASNNDIQVNDPEVYLSDLNKLKQLITNLSTGVLDDNLINQAQNPGQTLDFINFNTYANQIAGIGKLYWDGNGTLNIGMNSQLVQSIGLDTLYYIKASAPITQGQVVMFTGAVGASEVLQGAPATGVTNASYIMGIAAQNIALNAFGFVQAFGLVQNLNTNAWTPGTVLYYDPTVTGGLTSTRPSAPNVKVQLGAVINQNTGNGSIFVRRQETGSINNITEVQVTSPTANQVLYYNGTIWQNGTNVAADVAVTQNTTDALTYLTFVGADTGNNPILVNSGLTYNAVTNAITGGIDGGVI